MTEKVLVFGQSATRRFYVEQDSIRHLARISGSDDDVHSDVAVAVSRGHKHLVAQPALLEAYVHSVIGGELLQQSLASVGMSSQIYHLGSVCAGDHVTVHVSIGGLAEGFITVRAEVLDDNNREILLGTINIPQRKT